MDRNSEPMENKYLQVRKVALIKKHTKRIAIVAICASLFSFRFSVVSSRVAHWVHRHVPIAQVDKILFSVINI